MALLHRRPWRQDSDGRRPAARRTRQQLDHHQHVRRATDDKPSVTLQDQPAAHPTALISPADTAITSKLPSACLAIPRRRANQAGRWSPIAAEHLLCTGSDPLELKPRPAHIRRFFARSPPECRPRSASGVVTQRSSQGGQGCPGEADGRASKLHAVRERAVSGQRAWWLTERVPRWALAGIRAKGPPHRSAGRRPGSTAARCRRRRGWPAAGHRD